MSNFQLTMPLSRRKGLLFEYGRDLYYVLVREKNIYRVQKFQNDMNVFLHMQRNTTSTCWSDRWFTRSSHWYIHASSRGQYLHKRIGISLYHTNRVRASLMSFCQQICRFMPYQNHTFLRRRDIGTAQVPMYTPSIASLWVNVSRFSQDIMTFPFLTK